MGERMRLIMGEIPKLNIPLVEILDDGQNGMCRRILDSTV